MKATVTAAVAVLAWVAVALWCRPPGSISCCPFLFLPVLPKIFNWVQGYASCGKHSPRDVWWRGRGESTIIFITFISCLPQYTTGSGGAPAGSYGWKCRAAPSVAKTPWWVDSGRSETLLKVSTHGSGPMHPVLAMLLGLEAVFGLGPYTDKTNKEKLRCHVMLLLWSVVFSL